MNLDWCSSYLIDRFKKKIVSIPFKTLQGVSQGSVLGPLVFTSQLNIISRHRLSHHVYANVTQIHIPVSTENAQQLLKAL